MIKSIFLDILIIFSVNASCYEHPGLGWRWNDTNVGSVLNVYDHVRLDLTQSECRDKEKQVLFGIAESSAAA
jgi:hypothetical protein